ncbi:MAG: redox-sensing transcriptional repressor Rex [Pirellulaceae bacterium]|nr:redox-sensing transcriptional repressor Rex [Pirellulaceae bacterium]
MHADSSRNYPVPSVRRLPLYLRLLRELRSQGRETISCTHIAESLGLGIVQIRKDLAMTGIVGRPKVGYFVHDLINAIESFLGWTKTTDAVLVGAGSLGSAILGYDEFRSHGLRIVAAFDAAPEKIGRHVRGVKILAMGELPERVAQTGARIGIVTVPAMAAQEVAESLILAGIRAVWNFSPATLEVPARLVVENVRFVDSLAVLSQRLCQIDD